MQDNFTPNILQANLIEAFLSPFAQSVCASKIEVFKTIDSTNTEAKRRLSSAFACSPDNSAALHGSVLIAEHQSKGRGRSGKSFFSPAGSGIYLSLIYNPQIKDGNTVRQTVKTPDTSLFTPLAAVCVCRVFSRFGIDGKIKWVNDVFVNGKKVCGILTEGFIREKERSVFPLIVGIGINVHTARTAFPSELQNTAGSLSEYTLIDRNALAAALISDMLEIFSGREETCALMREYKDRSFILGKNVTVISPLEHYEATAADITDDARLIVVDSTGMRRELLSGEISLRL